MPLMKSRMFYAELHINDHLNHVQAVNDCEKDTANVDTKTMLKLY